MKVSGYANSGQGLRGCCRWGLSAQRGVHNLRALRSELTTAACLRVRLMRWLAGSPIAQPYGVSNTASALPPASTSTCRETASTAPLNDRMRTT